MKTLVGIVLVLLLTASFAFAAGGQNQGTTGSGTTSTGSSSQGTATQDRTGR
jgi:hypothetical protein